MWEILFMVYFHSCAGPVWRIVTCAPDFFLTFIFVVVGRWLASWWLFGISWISVGYWLCGRNDQKSHTSVSYCSLQTFRLFFFFCFLDSRENRMGSGKIDCRLINWDFATHGHSPFRPVVISVVVSIYFLDEGIHL